MRNADKRKLDTKNKDKEKKKEREDMAAVLSDRTSSLHRAPFPNSRRRHRRLLKEKNLFRFCDDGWQLPFILHEYRKINTNRCWNNCQLLICVYTRKNFKSKVKKIQKIQKLKHVSFLSMNLVYLEFIDYFIRTGLDRERTYTSPSVIHVRMVTASIISFNDAYTH